MADGSLLSADCGQKNLLAVFEPLIYEHLNQPSRILPHLGTLIPLSTLLLHLIVPFYSNLPLYTVFQKKISTHIIGYKLRNSCLILIIFDTKIPHIIDIA